MSVGLRDDGFLGGVSGLERAEVGGLAGNSAERLADGLESE